MRPIARAQSARASSVNQARKGRAKSKTIRRRCGDVAYIVDLRVGRFSDSTFPSFPPAPPLSPLLAAIYLLLLFPLGCATPRRGVLISITFGSQTRIGFLSLSLSHSLSLFIRTGQKAAVGRTARGGGRVGKENGWRKGSTLAGGALHERQGEGRERRGKQWGRQAEFNFSRSRSSVSARIFIPFRATTRPVISFRRALCGE